ncbi:hypothetical protein [Myxococcus phage Mx1]|nr:hypothetical protein [Myxococcus phage Mx1]
MSDVKNDSPVPKMRPVINYMALPSDVRKYLSQDDHFFGNDRAIKIYRDQFEEDGEQGEAIAEFLFKNVPAEYDWVFLYISW